MLQHVFHRLTMKRRLPGVLRPIIEAFLQDLGVVTQAGNQIRRINHVRSQQQGVFVIQPLHDVGKQHDLDGNLPVLPRIRKRL